MAKAAFHIMLILFPIVYAAAAEESTDDGVVTACEKTSNASFCAELLLPYASQFMDNDGNKMGYAAISATLAQVQSTRAYMVRQTTEPTATEKERSAVTSCLGDIGNSDDSLRNASQEFDLFRAAKGEQRSSHRESVIKMIDSARNDLTACSDLLKKHNDVVGAGIISESARMTERSIQACSVAEAFIH
ncbi:hypothetical protein SASPL_107593 [Salvia splendens]|uniref:Pectinesterase inhibitor domain-containing protein n=1 Tax=Salvia splendens TaxID=180675 RepID=A0A8X8YGP2_SALSN|nr:hypothetical protein SASPL_107593 [Salvia splendens]